ncbi:MAG TPA: hypothetical protein VGG15_12320 [Terriglobales bacterium]|jgi:hypothetical protein
MTTTSECKNSGVWLVAKYAIGDRVKLIGSPEVYEIDEIQDFGDSEVCYWTILQGESAVRAFVKERDLIPEISNP